MNLNHSNTKFFFLLIAFAVLSCKAKPKTNVENDTKALQTPTAPVSNVSGVDLNKFLANFETATLSHDPVQIKQFLNEDYISEQHDKFLKKNTTLFFDEFYSGGEVNASGHPKIEYTKITSMEKGKTSLVSGKFLTVSYKVSTSTASVNVVWTIMSALGKDSKVKYGLYGKIN
ncbi:MAG TPA: hypothetical protein VGF79_04255 [Bacteroidia bacterium]